MWSTPIHLLSHTSGVAAIIAALGLLAWPAFRYPHMWRYLESRRHLARNRAPVSPRSLADDHETDSRMVAKQPIVERSKSHRRCADDGRRSAWSALRSRPGPELNNARAIDTFPGQRPT